jgi:probable HAF family extracellular repeat protein
VGTYVDATGTHGFLYTGGNYTTITDPSAAVGETFATGINNSGQIVGYYYDSTGLAHGFIDTGGSFTTIDDSLGVEGTFLYGLNSNGQVVGYYIDGQGVTHGLEGDPIQNRPPVIDLANSVITGTVAELPNTTGSNALDYANNGSATKASGVIAFNAPDTTDRPTASIDAADQTITWQDANGNIYTLSDAQIAALKAGFSIAAESGNTSTGKIDWTYSIPDSSLDFLGAGETSFRPIGVTIRGFRMFLRPSASTI